MTYKFTIVKKLITAILALLFLSSSWGMTIHMHYCMDNLVASNVWHTDGDQDACNKCGMQKGDKKGCCKDEHMVFKTDNYPQTDITKIPTLEIFTLTLPPQHFVWEAPILSKIKQLPRSNAPPDSGCVPAYVFNCTFRI